MNCKHCGLPGEQAFCCPGCEAAWHHVHDLGLTDFYAIRARDRWTPQPVGTEIRTFADFDDPGFHHQHCRALEDGTMRIELSLDGIHCAACVWLLEQLPACVNGILQARLDFGRSRLHLQWDPGRCQLSQIARELHALGYMPFPATEEPKDDQDRRQLARLAVAGALAGNTMLISFALYAGEFSDMAPAHRQFFVWITTGLGMLALLWPGRVFFSQAWQGLRRGMIGMDVPIALALAAGGLDGLRCAFRGSSAVYFDSLAALVFLLLCGRYLQARQLKRARSVVSLLATFTPSWCHKITQEGTIEFPVSGLSVHDQVEVRPGATVPADGTILQGQSAIDEAVLTGESRPRSVQVGDTVHAGATNVTANLRLGVDAVGQQTRIGQLLQDVEAEQGRSDTSVQHDRLATAFVVITLLLAVIGGLTWWQVSPEHAIRVTVALLIVACPCALSLARPLTTAIAMARAAEAGILLQSARLFEHIAKPGTIFFDKTGTLTAGQPRLANWCGPEDVLQQAAAVESLASHPLAQAFSNHTSDKLEATNFSEHRNGVRAEVQGTCIAIGNRAFLSLCGVSVANDFLEQANAIASRGATAVFVARDSQCLGVAELSDGLRPEARDSVTFLQRQGWRVGILSGDATATVGHVAERLGIDANLVYAAATPEDKRAIIVSAAERGTVFMVGDGVNDAAALMAADIGLSVQGAEASMLASDGFLGRSGIAALPQLWATITAARTRIRQSLTVSICYNVLAVSLALNGWIGPLAAAILMPISSLTVAALALRQRRPSTEQAPALQPQLPVRA